MSKAFAGIGTMLKKGDGASPEVFTTVAEVKTIDWTNRKLDIVDVTNMDSPNFFREKLATLKDPGEISFEVNYVPSNTVQQAVLTDWNNRTLRNWKMTLPIDPSTSLTFGTWTFQAYITDTSIKLPTDNAGTQSLKITLTGLPVFIAGV